MEKTYDDNYTELSYTDTGLDPDTVYWYRVAARNEDTHQTDYDAVISTRTLIDVIPPAPVNDLMAVSGDAEKSVRLSWTAVGDDGLEGDITGGKYSIRYSSVSAVTENNWGSAYEILFDTDTSPGQAQGYTVGGLVPGVRYWFAIKTMDGINWSEIDTTPERANAAASGLTPPGSLKGTALSETSIKWEWDDNSDYEEAYYLYSGAGDLIATLLPDTTFFIETGLKPNHSYTRKAVISDETGRKYESEVFGKYTMAGVPSDPEAFGSASNAVYLSWSPNLNPEGTRYGVEISTSESASYSTVKGFADDFTETEIDVLGLSPGNLYFFRLAAFNGDGEVSSYISVSTTTLSDITEVLYGSGEEFEVTLDEPSDPETGESASVAVKVPVGAFSRPVKARIDKIDDSHPKKNIVEEALAKGRFSPVSGIYDFRITDRSGNKLEKTDYLKRITLEFTYTGRYNPAQHNLMRVFYLNESTGEWEEVADYSIDPEARKVYASVEHTSVYTVMQAQPVSLSGLVVYPNPLRTDQAVGGSMKFSGLPENVRLSIYNIAGELVYSKRFISTGGGIEWKAETDSGSRVASGVYIYVITDDSGKSKRGRIMVIR